MTRLCKRCGYQVAHPAQEYCGAACSARRKEPYPQPDERHVAELPAMPAWKAMAGVLFLCVLAALIVAGVRTFWPELPEWRWL